MALQDYDRKQEDVVLDSLMTRRVMQLIHRYDEERNVVHCEAWADEYVYDLPRACVTFAYELTLF